MTYYEATGTASWYGARHHGRPTANGETYDMHALTAAHPTLQLPSVVRVTNLANGRSLRLRVNDRGPFDHDRLITLSQAAARALGFEEQGLAEVHIIYLGMARLDEP
ncbi:MAG TPA: septal ring lytic transglycosylase RlpA family protein, partial [Geminicoccaceae bacterium]|nr:septal ring lytic transglycosylase RlpA family protein [Geminicoccaceae bacterium]